MTEKTHPPVGVGEKAEPLVKKNWNEVSDTIYNAGTNKLPAHYLDEIWPWDMSTDIIYNWNQLFSDKGRKVISEASYGISSGDATGVKGFTYQITEEMDFVFGTRTPNHAYWHRLYNTPAAFETIYQDYTTSMRKQGTTPSKSAPNTADSNPQPGAMWSVSLPPDGTQVGGFAAPGTDPRGIVYDSTYLWSCDQPAAYIYQLKTDGTQVGGFAAPGTNPFGLTWDGAYLWNADNNADYIYQLKTDGTQVSGFNSPGARPLGLTWDGTYLWNADTGANVIYKLKTDGTQVTNFSTPATGPHGVEWDGTYLWNPDYGANYVYQLKTNGTEVGGFAPPGTGTDCATWDGEYLWLTDDLAAYVYQLGNANSFDVNYRIFAK